MGRRVPPPVAGSPLRRWCSSRIRDRRFALSSWSPCNRLDQDLHPAGTEYTEQPEAEHSTEPLDAGVGLASASASARRCADRDPNFVASRGSIHGLKNEIEREAQLQLADHERDRRTAIHRHDVAAANLSFHLEPQPFEEALDRQIEARFQPLTSTRAASLRSTANQQSVRIIPAPGAIPDQGLKR